MARLDGGRCKEPGDFECLVPGGQWQITRGAYTCPNQHVKQCHADYQGVAMEKHVEPLPKRRRATTKNQKRKNNKAKCKRYQEKVKVSACMMLIRRLAYDLDKPIFNL